jgi:D-amino-acid dehydrogenase
MTPSSKCRDGKKVIIVGAGVVGLASAYRLANTGYEVTIVEQAAAPASGTSKGNAGQLLYNHISAMGSPGFLRTLPRTMFDRDGGVSVLGLIHPSKWPWGIAFLRQCTNKAWQQNTKSLIEIAHRSQKAMAEFTDKHDMDFSWRKPGKLLVHATAESLAAADETAQFQALMGGRHQVLDRAQCLEREPALEATSRQIAGAIYLPDAEIGDCHRFCQGLAAILTEKLNVRISYGVEITGLEQKNGRVTALTSRQGLIEGDIFVLATGRIASKLLPGRSSNIEPVTGVKGLSVTFPTGDDAPDMSVTDVAGKFVVMRQGDEVRVAGYAIFSDNLTINPDHVSRLIDKARALMPGAALYEQPSQIWAGLRPQTPSALPIIKQAAAKNLYINAGHGSTGWILSFGSAEILQERIEAD